MSSKQALSILKQTYSKWSAHNATRLGASVAFYSILSFAPLLILITAVIAIVFGHDSAQSALVSEARQLMGSRGAESVQSLLKNAQHPASGIVATVIALATLLFGASGVFIELQDALNLIWDADNPSAAGLVGMLRQRLLSFGMVLSVGFVLLVTLLLSAALEYMGQFFSHLLPMPHVALEILNFLFSFGVTTFFFALILRYVPAIRVCWRNVMIGSVGTAFLFTIGKFLLGLYLGRASIDSAYGAAGSLVAVVIWIYYSAQIFFFGAEFTRVYADRPQARAPSASKASA